MALASVLQYEGDNSTFIWKHLKTNFNTMTQLIVHENQEAVFFMNGEALDLFGPGRHTLETQNIPKIGGFLKRATGKNPFHCEVYFINKTVQMSIKWGTDSRVRFLEPTYGVPLEIGACGEMNLAVSDSRKLLIKLVGTMKGIAWEDENGGFAKSLQASFRPLISSAVKEKLASCIKTHSLNILEIDENLGLLSGVLKNSIFSGFEEYGLTIPEFYVTNVVLPEEDPNFRKIRDLHALSLQQKSVEAETAIKTAQAASAAAITAAEREAALEKEKTATEMAKMEAERELIRAQTEAQSARMSGLAEAEVMRAKGYSEKDVLQAEVQKAYAEGIGNMNLGSGGGGSGIAGDMIGLGVGMAAAGAMAPQMSEMFKGLTTPATEAQKVAKITCSNCHSEVPENSKFCLECGSKIELLAENEMLCPACGKKTAKGKFCMECGAILVAKCEKCGAELPAGAKFCLECGEKL